MANTLEPGAPSHLPVLPLDLSQKKLPIFLNWFPILLTSGILPLVLYFTLHYLTTLNLTIVLTIPLTIMGVVSLSSLLFRTWKLYRNPDCRPLGLEQNKWTFDFFNWNFIFGFVVLTIVISVGIGIHNLHLTSLPLTILILYISLEMLLAQLAMALGISLPVRISSLPAGSATRPGTYIIAEDVVAVDGGLGSNWRRAWNARYEADPDLQTLLKRLDLLWGTSGLAIVAITWGIIFGVSNEEVGFAVGWSLPWIWAGCMVGITVVMGKGCVRRARARGVVGKV